MSEWKPSPRQAKFLSLPYSIKEALYGGGVNSAKTETLIYYPIVHKFHENPRFKQVILRRTYPELNREVVPRAKRIYRPFGANYNGTDKVFTFPSGAQVWLGHCETEDDVHKYDSMEINLFSPDELTSFTEWQYLYLAFERVRSPKGSGLPAVIRAAGMPGDIGHTWVKNRFVLPYRKIGINNLYDCGDNILLGRGGIKRIYIHATVLDNPHADPEYLKSLDALPEAEKRAKKYGDWDAYLGQVFEEFRDRHYPDEPENALHVIEPFKIPEFWPRIVVGDWGFAANTWIGFAAIAPNGRVYIYRELHWKRTKISQWAPIAKQFIDDENPKLVKFCQSAKQHTGQEHTIQQQIEEALDHKIELTGNVAGSRIAGKILLHEYFRWQPIPKIAKENKAYDDNYAMWLMRNKGLESYNDYLNSFRPVEEECIPKLQIFNTCKLLIDAIKACTYEKSTDKPAEDVAEFDGDDPYDGIRYIVDAASRYIAESKHEFSVFQQRQELAEEFERNPDYNMLFMRARAMENRNKVRSIRRYH